MNPETDVVTPAVTTTLMHFASEKALPSWVTASLPLPVPASLLARCLSHRLPLSLCPSLPRSLSLSHSPKTCVLPTYASPLSPLLFPPPETVASGSLECRGHGRSTSPTCHPTGDEAVQQPPRSGLSQWERKQKGHRRDAHQLLETPARIRRNFARVTLLPSTCV